MSYYTPLKKARGLGSAKEGAHHWWMERLSSIILIPLIIWFVVAVIRLTAGAEDPSIFLNSLFNVVMLLLLFVVSLYHSTLGMQVVIEDYVHHKAWKFGLLITIQAASFVTGVTGVIAVVARHFGVV